MPRREEDKMAEVEFDLQKEEADVLRDGSLLRIYEGEESHGDWFSFAIAQRAHHYALLGLFHGRTFSWQFRYRMAGLREKCLLAEITARNLEQAECRLFEVAEEALENFLSAKTPKEYILAWKHVKDIETVSETESPDAFETKRGGKVEEYVGHKIVRRRKAI